MYKLNSFSKVNVFQVVACIVVTDVYVVYSRALMVQIHEMVFNNIDYISETMYKNQYKKTL